MDDRPRSGSWWELRRHGRVVTVLACGVLMAATSIYVAASVLPTAVPELGGRRLYAWNMTVFLVAQLVGTTLASRTPGGAARAYLRASGLFATGSVLCAISPFAASMLFGRGVQGLGAGLLLGLGFAMVHAALPRRLWTHGLASISAMFGVGNVLGPVVGGLLAQLGWWRLAFAVLAVPMLVMMPLATRVLPSGVDGAAPAIPIRSLALLVAVAATISTAGLFTSAFGAAWLVVIGLGLAVAFLAVERRGPVRLLPGATYQGPGRLRWIYATVALLASGVAVEMFLPLFGQGLGGLPPFAAGFYAATLSLGWTLAQLLSSSARRPAVVRALSTGGPVCTATAFAVLGLLQQPAPPSALVMAWLPIVFVAGAGIGVAMPHLSVAVLTSARDPQEGRAAASSVATVLTVATATGTAVAGLLVNLGGPDLTSSARTLLGGFAVITCLAVLTARRAG